MTHEFAQFLLEALILEYGEDVTLGSVLSDNVTILPQHKQGLLEGFGADTRLAAALERLVPPTNREEIVDHACRNCGGSDCEIMKTIVNMQEAETWVCKTCGHQTLLPPAPDDEEDEDTP